MKPAKTKYRITLTPVWRASRPGVETGYGDSPEKAIEDSKTRASLRRIAGEDQKLRDKILQLTSEMNSMKRAHERHVHEIASEIPEIAKLRERNSELSEQMASARAAMQAERWLLMAMAHTRTTEPTVAIAAAQDKGVEVHQRYYQSVPAVSAAVRDWRLLTGWPTTTETKKVLNENR